MTDITERLRWDKRYTRGHVPVTVEDAAKEIERLQAEVVKWQAEAGKFTPGIEAAEALLDEAKAEIERLMAENAKWSDDYEIMMRRCDLAEVERDRLHEAIWQIHQWSRAYPLHVFPEPDLKKAAELLNAGGITLDAISAHCMRHVVEGVGNIAREALHKEPDHGQD
jgi:uncharacterized small protein (DUF1192 family)